MENQEIVWCVYCEREVKTLDAPKSYDNDAWREIAQEHAGDCEWVTTRAHTIFTEQDMIENGMLPEPHERGSTMFYVMTADAGEDAMIEDSLPTREEAQSVADSMQGYDMVFVADEAYVKAHGSKTHAELQRDKEHEAAINDGR